MRKKLFLDTNVILDFFLERDPFSAEAEILFKMRDDEKVDFYISALSLANLAYHVQRSKKDPFHIISLFIKWVHVIDLERDHFTQTLSSRFKDFEDGLQYYSAIHIVGIDAIITRNKKDFFPSQIPVYTPGEFLLHL